MSEFIKATSINHCANGNFQIDYSGSQHNCIAAFEDYCIKNNVLWAKLFNAKDGNEIYSFQRN
jgi:hypothetical protein